VRRFGAIRLQALGPVLALLLLGITWGLTMPLTKIAVSGGDHAFGLVVWELVVAALLLAAINLLRRRSFRFRLAHLKMFLFISLVGNLLPTILWFVTAAHLPSGVLSIILSLVPMFALPVALVLRLERFQWQRLLGVMLGALAIAFLVGPQTSLPNRSDIWFVLLALIAPFCYGIEGNGIAKIGMGGLDPVQMLFGATLFSLCFAVPLALFSGQWMDILHPWGAAEYALLATALLTTLAYAGYIWLVGRAGSVFAAQVSYLVTGFGILWSILLLSESYSGWVWLSLLLMLAGLFLVQPRRKQTLVPEAASGDNSTF